MKYSFAEKVKLVDYIRDNPELEGVDAKDLASKLTQATGLEVSENLVRGLYKDLGLDLPTNMSRARNGTSALAERVKQLEVDNRVAVNSITELRDVLDELIQDLEDSKASQARLRDEVELLKKRRRSV